MIAATQRGRLATFYSGRKILYSPTVSDRYTGRELTLSRQIEMFAGVAASSMPTVHLFFSHRKFPLWSWHLSVISSLLRLTSRSNGEKIPGENDQPGSGGVNMHSFGNGEGFMMETVKTDGREPGMVGDSQIYLTHDVTVTEEQLPERYNEFDARGGCI
jgi:hypothetical protein